MVGCGDMYGWSWWWMLVPTLFWAALVVLAAWAVARVLGNGRRGPSDALDILERRYARGDIDRDEYERRRRDLAGLA